MVTRGPVGRDLERVLRHTERETDRQAESVIGIRPERRGY